jgi:hypothetical protein
MQLHPDAYGQLPRFTTDAAHRDAEVRRLARAGARRRPGIRLIAARLWARLVRPRSTGLDPRPA